MFNKDAESEFQAGHDLMEKGDFSEALKRYKKSISLKDEDSRYWISLGVCLLKLRHWNEAEKALKKGIDLKPHYAEADARLFLADALINGGKKKEALAQWEYISTMEPFYPSHEKPMEEAKAQIKKFSDPFAS